MVISCQENQPSEQQVYQAKKAENHLVLAQNFDALIATQKAPKGDDATTTAISKQGIQELKTTLLTLKETDKDDKDATTVTPSTSIEDLNHLDSVSAAVSSTAKVNDGALLLHVRNYQDTYNKVYKLADQYNFNIASEEEHTTDFHKGNTLTIEMEPEQFPELVKEFRNLASIIRKKQIWQQDNSYDFLTAKSKITTTKDKLEQLQTQLAKTNNLKDQLLLQDKITETTETLDVLVLNATNNINQKAYSTITLSFYQEMEMAKPAPTTFSADFGSNLVLGWANFKQFVLNAALIWPYIIIGLIFLLTVLLAVRSSRKQARQFKLQMLHGQNMQQQITQYKATKN